MEMSACELEESQALACNSISEIPGAVILVKENLRVWKQKMMLYRSLGYFLDLRVSYIEKRGYFLLNPYLVKSQKPIRVAGSSFCTRLR
jgi:hypothetical protein